ncbi:MAG: co-chaperone YbbN [Rhodospirillales bacterium]|jgi:putative thioredoxin|nr:co-chaperone YbbN [Rhodospirillales bacterium]
MALILDPTAPQPGPAGGADEGDLIKDSDTANFMADVVEPSMVTPVIVDFWAPWCQPCKQLGPAIEKLVRNAGGLVRLVKVNVDENRELAQQLNIQSIPAVFGFSQGRPVDGFTGALPEGQIKSFIDRLTGGAKTPIESVLEAAFAALDEDDAALAAEGFAQVLAQDPANPEAIGGMIRCFIATNDTDQANDVIGRLPPELKSQPPIAAAIAAFELAQQGGETIDAGDLRQRLASDENDHAARFDLAMALYGGGNTEEAIDELIELVRRNRDWNDEAARMQLIKIFDALGPSHALCVTGRRRLSTVLFS